MDADVVVIGGGHAGIEAVFAVKHLGLKPILVTLNKKMIGNTPCNPHIGGSAKGIVVREIDALGGMMGKLADHNPLQVKILNLRKGPGVRCLRAQVDKLGYPAYVQSLLEEEGIEVVEGEAVDFIHDEERVSGVILRDGTRIDSKAVIVTTGTYMDSRIIRGEECYKEGPDGDPSSIGLSESLRKMGISTWRLKTGTPPRIDRDTIDFSKAKLEPGQEGHLCFSYLSKQSPKLADQLPCHLIYTSDETLNIIRENIKQSALYNGTITSNGPRYCPSIESKVMRFGDKERHQLFLEPETRDGKSIYLQGFSTAFPRQIQEKLVHSLPGLENAKILKYAYQIEYDALSPFQFDYSLRIKKYKGLYGAGQILGTSGYEEAAGLGLLAAINAVREIRGEEPIVLRRDQAYIGVMVDDIVAKGTDEPYRLLSSRAEYRLSLRHDNADLRLTALGKEIGLVDGERWNSYLNRKKRIEKGKTYLEEKVYSPGDTLKAILEESGYPDSEVGLRGDLLLKRPGVELSTLIEHDKGLKAIGLLDDDVLSLETEIKYEGYLRREREEAKRLEKSEEVILPPDLDYSSLEGLRLEAREKLSSVKPFTLGQAQRIPGVNPADCAYLLLALKLRRNDGKTK